MQTLDIERGLFVYEKEITKVGWGEEMEETGFYCLNYIQLRLDQTTKQQRTTIHLVNPQEVYKKIEISNCSNQSLPE